MTLTALADRHLVLATEPETRHVLLTLTAPPAPKRARGKAARPPVNVCFVLDRSGSMAGQKIGLARYAVDRAIDGLTSRDRFSVVAYDDQIEVVVDHAKATADAKHRAHVQLQAVDSRGSTALHGGWSRGADILKAHLDPKGVNRVLLLTDGLANVGETDPTKLAGFAADLRASGIPTSTFGLGAGFNETLLQAIADAGGGHFYYIEHPDQIPDFMTGELGELLETVAREVVIDVKYPPALVVEPVSPVVAKAEVPGVSRILLGDLVAEQVLELVLAVHFPPIGAVGEKASAFFTVADRDQVLKADGCSLEWESAEPKAVKAEMPNAEVLKAVARLQAAAAREVAVEANRSGDYWKAAATLNQVSMFVRDIAPGDAPMQQLADELTNESLTLSQFADENVRKQVYFSATNLARSRDASGRARRREPRSPEQTPPRR